VISKGDNRTLPSISGLAFWRLFASDAAVQNQRDCRAAATDRSKNGIKDDVQLFADVLGEEPQHEIAMLLQHAILSSITPVRDRVRKVLRAVNLDRHSRVPAQKVHLEAPDTVEGNR
jgi:hypothetical protein